MTVEVADGRTRHELAEERDFLLRSLDDLERERAAGDIDESDYLALRDDYTARTASVLRAIDGVVRPDAPPVSTAGAVHRRSALRPVLWVAGVLAFAVVAGLLVAGGSGERSAGGTLTGAIDEVGPAGELARARAQIGAGKLPDAIKTYDGVLRRDPQQPEALTYRGWILRLVGRQAGRTELIDRGLASIEQAEASDPGYADAHVFRGLILYQDRRDPKAAIPELRTFLGLHPSTDMVPVVEQVLRQAVSEAGQGAPTEGAGTVAPPPDAPPTTSTGADPTGAPGRPTPTP